MGTKENLLKNQQIVVYSGLDRKKKKKKESQSKKVIGKGKSSDRKSFNKRRKGSRRKWAEEDHQTETTEDLTAEPESKNEAISGPTAVGNKAV